MSSLICIFPSLKKKRFQKSLSLFIALHFLRSFLKFHPFLKRRLQFISPDFRRYLHPRPPKFLSAKYEKKNRRPGFIFSHKLSLFRNRKVWGSSGVARNLPLEARKAAYDPHSPRHLPRNLRSPLPIHHPASHYYHPASLDKGLCRS